jgi:hypothetical protein
MNRAAAALIVALVISSAVKPWSLAARQPTVTTPVTMAVLPAGLGREVDGIIGGAFIKQFVLELDYQARTMTLHDPKTFTFERPIALFAQDKAGAFANASLAGNIGAQIAMRFRMFLDYGRRRLILEPSPAFGESFDRAFSGVAMRSEGPDYRTIRVKEVLEDSPAATAGIQPAARQLTIRRADEIVNVTLTPVTFENLALLHHKARLLQGPQIVERIARHADDVGESSLREHANLAGQAHGTSGRQRGGTKRGRCIEADRREMLELACIGAVRNHAGVGAKRDGETGSYGAAHVRVQC